MSDPQLANLADALMGLTDEEQKLSVQNYVVDHVVAGGSADGVTAVFLAVGGSIVPAPYLSSYTSPAAADQVRVLIVNNSPTILGRPIGFPSI